MAKDGYVNIALPDGLVRQIKVRMKNNPGYGYKTVPECIKEGIRLWMREVDDHPMR